MVKAKKTYEKRVEYYSHLLEKISKDIGKVGMLRLLVAATIVATFLLNRRGNQYISYGVLLCGVAIFIYLIVMNRKLKNLYKYVSNLKEVNDSSVMRLEGKWLDFEDKGLEFRDESHRFSYDLDIFGQGSLFQWINSGKTHMGRSRLANMLTDLPRNKDTIKRRQDAISELARKRWWRQRLQAEAKMISKDDINKSDLINWATRRKDTFSKKNFIIRIRCLPIITISMMVLFYFFFGMSGRVVLFLLVPQFLMIYLKYGKMTKEFDLVHKHHNSIKVYRRILKHFENTHFSSEYLNELKKKIEKNTGVTAIEELKRLETILSRTLNRNNMMFFPINVITLWDYQCMIDLERWKRQSGSSVGLWLEVVGEIEALSSLGTIGHDYPDWTIPIITKEPSIVEAKSLGHPLLTNKMVRNDITIKEPSRILLITGSNMSGKSTLLRTIGINLALAYSGAPVCGEYMKASILDIYTCMRISDNLEKGISSFYGELLRIKDIVEESKKDKQVFFLLDEIFKGTNSYDRHIGAKTLIKQLYNKEAMGLVSTHDLELGDLERESNGNIKNYHFQEDYKDNEIYFDYKLKPGVSTTRNALYLIKMIGIEVEEQ